MPRSGEIGEQIFEQVEQLRGEGLSRTEAFNRISEESGRRAGTVAANYYRVARKRAGGSLRGARNGGRSTPARAAGGRRGGRRAQGGDDIDALARELIANVEALAAAVTAQAAEVKDLRSRLDGVRKLLGS